MTVYGNLNNSDFKPLKFEGSKSEADSNMKR